MRLNGIGGRGNTNGVNMITVIIFCVVAGCFFAASLYVNMETNEKHSESECMLRDANTRLHEANIIWERIKKTDADATARFVRNMRGDSTGRY